MPSLETVWKIIFRLALGKTSPVYPDIVEAIDDNPIIERHRLRMERAWIVRWVWVVWMLLGVTATLPLVGWAYDRGESFPHLLRFVTIFISAYLVGLAGLILHTHHIHQRFRRSSLAKQICTTPFGGFRCAIGILCVNLTGAMIFHLAGAAAMLIAATAILITKPWLTGVGLLLLFAMAFVGAFPMVLHFVIINLAKKGRAHLAGVCVFTLVVVAVLVYGNSYLMRSTTSSPLSSVMSPMAMLIMAPVFMVISMITMAFTSLNNNRLGGEIMLLFDVTEDLERE